MVNQQVHTYVLFVCIHLYTNLPNYTRQGFRQDFLDFWKKHQGDFWELYGNK